MILDHRGNLIAPSASPGAAETSGWVETGSPTAKPITGAPRRAAERTRARYAYLTNPLFYGAMEVIQAFVLGEGISYGEMHDERAQVALEEFWHLNTLHDLAERYFTEYMVDGEALTLFPSESRDLRRRPDQPARIGLYDVTMPIEFDTRPGVPSEPVSVLTESNTLHTESQFHWQAHKALWNHVRGYPVFTQALGAAFAYLEFMETRIRLHKKAARINAVYKAFIHSRTPAEAIKEQRSKGKDFGRVPRDGAVLTLAMNPENGQGEEFDWLDTNMRASDAEVDARNIRMLMATAIGLPLHYLGDGMDVNRATSSNMSAPAKRGMLRRQSIVRGWITAIYRLELKRRFGSEQEYAVIKRDLKGGQVVRETQRLKADLLEPNVLFPVIDDDNVEDILTLVETATRKGWMSQQTAQGKLGIDPALEAELIGDEGTQGGGGDDDEEESEGEPQDQESED